MVNTGEECGVWVMGDVVRISLLAAALDRRQQKTEKTKRRMKVEC